MEKQEKYPYRVVLLRHGESAANRDNAFGGWINFSVSEEGLSQVTAAANLLIDQGFRFDVGYTSALNRAIDSLHTILTVMNQQSIPEVKTWRLNERHYGGLQGVPKAKAVELFGEEKVQEWRRGSRLPPPGFLEPKLKNFIVDPPLGYSQKEGDERKECDSTSSSSDTPTAPIEVYTRVTYPFLPLGVKVSPESLLDVVKRLEPFLNDLMSNQLAEHKSRTVLIVAHGNSLRAMMKIWKNMTEEELREYNIPNAVPLVVYFDKDLKMCETEYLCADQQKLNEHLESLKTNWAQQTRK